MVKVKIFEDRMGNILAEPVREDIKDRIISHLRDFEDDPDGRAFFQEGGPAQEFMERLSEYSKRKLRNEHIIFINMDPWELGHYYGWDTHTLFE